MITLFGVAYSRAARCLWMLEELGIAYKLDPVIDTHSPEFLAINPNGKVPALSDGALTIWESVAINCYLARRYPSGLSANDIEQEAHCLKWSFWAQAELECFFNHVTSPDEVTAAWCSKTFGVLERQLRKTSHLIGARFTVADLNVAMMFMGPLCSRTDLTALPHTQSWLAACRARPAAVRVRDMMRAAFASRSESGERQ